MCNKFIRSFALLAILLSASSLWADILRIHVDDTIQPITEEYISRAIDKAKAEHCEALIIELNTPGGLVSSMREIIEKILASDVPVIVYVTPSGGYAASAGFFILEAADIAAMAPGTNTGAAHPILENGEKMDDVLKMKLENDVSALMRSVATQRGRNVKLAESGVRESKSWTDKEALTNNLVDFIARDTDDLIKQLDGREIKRFNGQKLILHLAGKRITNYEMSFKQDILAPLMNPNMVFFIFVVGILALYFE